MYGKINNMKHTAWQPGDDEIYTVEKNHDTLYAVILVVVITGFIAGEIFIRTL